MQVWKRVKFASPTQSIVSLFADSLYIHVPYMAAIKTKPKLSVKKNYASNCHFKAASGKNVKQTVWIKDKTAYSVQLAWP